jgi:hypothetical protein
MATAKAMLATTTTTVASTATWRDTGDEKTEVSRAAATTIRRGSDVGNGDKSESDETMCGNGEKSNPNETTSTAQTWWWQR